MVMLVKEQQMLLLINLIINYKLDKKYIDLLNKEANLNSQDSKAVDGLYIKNNVDLYTTGPNVNLLSIELSTLLSGRYIEIKMLPLYFKEYKSFYNNMSDDELYRKSISFGAFPYVTNFDLEDDVSLYLGSLYNNILIKDVIDRKKISDELILKSVANYMLDNIGNILSTNNVANTMTSNGRNRIALKYIEGLIESFFFYRANRYDIKGKQYLKTCE